MISLLEYAMQYKHAGFSVIAVKENKKSLYRWRKYQYILIGEEELVKQFSDPYAKGIAIICGKISGNLETIDMDCKYDLTNCLFQQFIQSVNEKCPKLVARLVIAATRNDGYHLFYRCREIGKSIELAKRYCTDFEINNNPDEKVKVLIEMRANGGYVIVYPTDGYQFIQHDLTNVPLIEPEERQILLNIARLFDECQIVEPTISNSYPAYANNDPYSPFEDYNNRGNVVDLLQNHGWKVVRHTPVKTYFQRPGNTDHETSGDYNHELGLFGVFSTSTEFKKGKGYKPSAVYAILECDGNFKLAAKRLLAEGYGVAYKERC